MSAKTGIEWTDSTWNPIRGCTRVSEGCRNCYAERQAMRDSGPGGAYEGLVTTANGHPSWTGAIRFVEEHLLDPLSWRKPRRIFVDSMSDLFHENVTDEMRDKIFAVMALCPQHTFQVLTKRPERMLAYLDPACGRIADIVMKMRKERGDKSAVAPLPHIAPGATWWPLPNVWLGTSVEDQKTADERIPLLMKTPAAVRFISSEPLLGLVDISWVVSRNRLDIGAGFLIRGHFSPGMEILRPLDWVICGGESGPSARPMHPDWARSLRDQCHAAGVPFFFKQWGEWAPGSDFRTTNTCAVDESGRIAKDGLMQNYPPGASSADGWEMMHRAGKKAAGAVLDGQEWKQFPEASA